MPKKYEEMRMDTKLWGGILLIIGTSIGGGMLGLPIVSSQSGFWASTAMLIGCWAIMTFSAFLILEVNLWLPPRNNLISMARTTLGRPGAFATWISYILLLYALLSAYISGGAGLFHAFSLRLGLNISPWLNAVLFVVVFGLIVIRGIQFVDYANRALMIAKLGSLFLLIFFALPHVEQPQLFEGNPFLVTGTITVMLTSFGFANIIPSLRSYFDDNVKKLRVAVLIGSLIPLVCYILWDFAILGVLPSEELKSILKNGGSIAALTESLSIYLNNTWITLLIAFFTSICVLTAFLCVSLALSDFLADGLQIDKHTSGKWIVYGLTFLPALLIVIINQNIFVQALNYAGIFCVVLIVLLPALMVFRGRYRLHLPSQYQVMGGKYAILGIILISFAIILFGLWEAFSHLNG